MTLSLEQIRVLDRLREQLDVASKMMGITKQELANRRPLPPWESLQSDQRSIIQNIVDVQETLDKHRNFLTALHAYPLPSFPGHTKEILLQNLLRKKLDVVPEDWIARYSTQRASPNVNGAADHEGEGGLDRREYLDLWNSVAESNTAFVREFRDSDALEDDYTIAEREAGVENVVTGLRRDESDEEEDEEDAKMEDAMPGSRIWASPEPGIDTSLTPMQMETLLRFMTTGTLPQQQQ